MKNPGRSAITLLIAAVMLMATLTACGTSGTNDVDVSDMIFLGSSNDFEAQEVAEAQLTAKGIPYTVVNAGTTSRKNLAEVNAELIFLKNGQSGYYVNKDETVILKVFTYVEPEPTPEKETKDDDNDGNGNDGDDSNDNPADTDPSPTQEPSGGSSSNVDWQQFLNDYEKWIDSYVAFMKKYQDNPTDMSLLIDYMELLEEMIEWSEKADEIQDDMSATDLQEYLATLTRILAKLSQV